MKSKTLALLLVLPLWLPLGSCFLGRTGVNQPLDPEAVASLKIGVTAADVVAKMGAPDEVVQLGRRSAYRYSHNITLGTGSYWIILGLYNEDRRRDQVWFFFDENQKLTHKGATYQSHRAGFHALPWSNCYDEEDGAAADKKRGLK